MTHATAASGTTTPVPGQRTTENLEEALSPSDGGAGSARPVAFDRLLSVAVLTPAQAVLVAVQLLDAVDTVSSPAEGDLSGTGLDAVTLTPSGDLHVEAAHPDEGTPVSDVLEQLLQNARRLPAHPKHEQVLLLQRLEELTAAPLLEPAARARELEASLADTLGPHGRRRLSGQLAALVQAFAHVAPDVPGAVLPPGPPVPVPHRTGPGRARKRPSPRKRALTYRRRRVGRVGLVALVLAAALAVSSYVALGPGAAFVRSLGPGKEPAAPPVTAPSEPPEQSLKQPQSPRRQALPALAGRHAGAITGVTLEKTGDCRPGGICQVKVTVRLRPASTTQPVSWKVGAARLCRRGLAWSTPTTVTAEPGWTTVYAYSSIRVPKDRRLALVALTTTPARAQSQPVPVTGSSLRC